MDGPEGVREFIVAHLTKGAREKGLAALEARDDLHMVDSGLLDSMEFLGLLTALEERFGLSVDLADADPDDFLTIGGLARLAAASLAAKKA